MCADEQASWNLILVFPPSLPLCCSETSNEADPDGGIDDHEAGNSGALHGNATFVITGTDGQQKTKNYQDGNFIVLGGGVEEVKPKGIASSVGTDCRQEVPFQLRPKDKWFIFLSPILQDQRYHIRRQVQGQALPLALCHCAPASPFWHMFNYRG